MVLDEIDSCIRGSDGHCFNVIELIIDVDFKKMAHWSKVKENILTLDDVVIFQPEEQCRGGSMQFAHILRAGKDEIVQVNAARFAIEKQSS